MSWRDKEARNFKQEAENAFRIRYYRDRVRLTVLRNRLRRRLQEGGGFDMVVNDDGYMRNYTSAMGHFNITGPGADLGQALRDIIPPQLGVAVAFKYRNGKILGHRGKSQIRISFRDHKTKFY